MVDPVHNRDAPMQEEKMNNPRTNKNRCIAGMHQCKQHKEGLAPMQTSQKPDEPVQGWFAPMQT
ncbi:hypothetical protein L195_g046882, partial [Trifolium pratense]